MAGLDRPLEAVLHALLSIGAKKVYVTSGRCGWEAGRAENCGEPGESLPFRVKTSGTQYQLSQIPQGHEAAMPCSPSSTSSFFSSSKVRSRGAEGLPPVACCRPSSVSAVFSLHAIKANGILPSTFSVTRAIEFKTVAESNTFPVLHSHR